MRDINNTAKVEEVLNSLDGMRRATPGPFFFTRVQARLQRQRSGRWEQVTSFITRPAVALAGICMIVLLNAVAVYYQPEGPANAGMMAVSGNGDQSYADAYGSAASNFLYDENQEP